MPTELGVGAVVLRFVLDESRFIPAGIPYPNGVAIEPSQEDKAHAKNTDTAVRVSVWDVTRTTVAQAVALRETSKSYRKFHLEVFDVKQASETFQNPRLRVVEDPLPPELSSHGGADGHCGIEGLDRGSTPRPVWRDMLNELAKSLVEIDAQNTA